ncbi:MAG: carbohydrate kinase [Flavobacteriaceae bacterium]|nr:carbohydrate kinase [Flavobacteriaceae bacterium]
MKTIDILSVGELLIDFIGHEENASINSTNNYQRFLGGSPTNVAVNASRLSLRSMLVAACGKDGLGDFAVEKLKENKVDVSGLKQIDNEPTSVILVSKTTETPDFVSFRQTDFQITEDQLTDNVLSSSSVFHTTCFALSKNPSRQTILNRAKKAKALGLELSIDLNYSEKIWPNREEAHRVIKEYMSNAPLLKLSNDDCERLFAEKKSETYIFDFFHNLGAKTICLTKGDQGVVVSDLEKGLITQHALKIEKVKDATGAGDAFWTGFLFAQINNYSLENCIKIAQKLAAIKLQSVGQLPKDVDILAEILA